MLKILQLHTSEVARKLENIMTEKDWDNYSVTHFDEFISEIRSMIMYL